VVLESGLIRVPFPLSAAYREQKTGFNWHWSYKQSIWESMASDYPSACKQYWFYLCS